MKKKALLILPAGRFRHPRGMQVIDRSAILRVLRGIKKQARDLTVDYEHESFKSQHAETAGHLLHGSVYENKSGLYGNIKWTRKALENIKNRRFRYLSPALVFDPQRSADNELRIERLAGIGLTNNPNIPLMEPVFNQLQMEEKMDDFSEKLKTALNLSPSAQEADTLEKIVETIKRRDSLEEELLDIRSAVGASIGSSPEDVLALVGSAFRGAQPAPSMEEWKALKEELEQLRQKETAGKVQNAIMAGKLLPAQRDWALGYATSDPAGFSGFLANSRAVVSMGELVENDGRASVINNEPLSPEQEKVNRLLGISKEVFNSYNHK